MPDRPNFVLIMTDQHRWDCLGLAGHPHLLTPNLDALAHRGIYFRRAYTPAPICCPARRSLLTGHAPATDGCLDNTPVRIPRPEDTLPHLLRRAGYETVSVGRTMHQFPEHHRYGFEQVFRRPHNDRYSRFAVEVPALSPRLETYPHHLDHGLPLDGYTARSWPYREEFHESNYSVARAIQYLDERDREQPFFLYLGVVAPHPPLCPPAFYFDRYHRMADLPGPHLGDWAHPPANGGRGLGVQSTAVELSGEAQRSALAGYLGLINHFDDLLYNFFNRLAQEGTNTYVLFTSDHGEMLGDHYLFRKMQPYEAVVRVPFLLAGPGLPRQKVIDAPVSLIDILPTFCELAGVTVPDHVEGRSLVPLWNGALDSSGPAEHLIHGEIGDLPFVHNHRGCHYLTDGQRKYIWFSANGREQFFDIAADPHEQHDLATEANYRDEVSLWRSRLAARLHKRPERFSDGHSLTPSTRHSCLLPHAIRCHH
jgi:arylsulfatase